MDIIAHVEDDQPSTFSKFAQVFFRDSSKPQSQTQPIKQSLLKFSRPTADYAVQINRILLKLSLEDFPADIILNAVNFICDKINLMKEINFHLSGGVTPVDELFCQLMKLTYSNPEK